MSDLAVPDTWKNIGEIKASLEGSEVGAKLRKPGKHQTALILVETKKQ